MFHYKIGKIQRRFALLKMFISIGTTIALFCLGLLVFPKINTTPNGEVSQSVQIIMFVLLVGLCLATVIVFISLIQRQVVKKIHINQCINIVKTTKIPTKAPKIIYLYSTHNDFELDKLLNNSKQTYKNIETWIADGSTDLEMRKKIQQVAKKYKFNLCQMPESGSKNKADNLNYFLRNSGTTFDYLIICDADEVIPHEFAETTIKYFLANNQFRKLGYVTPSQNIYRNIEKSSFWTKMICADAAWNATLTGATNQSMYMPLFSASSLVSKKLIDEMGGCFYDSNLEDLFTEAYALKNKWQSHWCPISVCNQGADNTFSYFVKRCSRVQEWYLILIKKKPFDSMNEKYSSWYKRSFMLFLTPFVVVLSFIALIAALPLLIIYWPDLSKSYLTYAIIGIIAFNLLVSLIRKTYLSIRMNGISGVLYVFFQFIFFEKMIKLTFTSWVKVMIKHTHSNFLKKTNEKKKPNKIKKTIVWNVINLLIVTSLAITFNTSLFLTNVFTTSIFSNISEIWKLYIFVGFNVIFALAWILCFSALITSIMDTLRSKRDFFEEQYEWNDFLFSRKKLDKNGIKMMLGDAQESKKNLQLVLSEKCLTDNKS